MLDLGQLAERRRRVGGVSDGSDLDAAAAGGPVGPDERGVAAAYPVREQVDQQEPFGRPEVARAAARYGARVLDAMPKAFDVTRALARER